MASEKVNKEPNAESTTEPSKEHVSSGISRRDFFKVTGIAAGLATAGILAQNTPAVAGEKADSGIVNFAVRTTEKPPYENDFYSGSEKLYRIKETDHGFNNTNLAKQYFNGRHWRVAIEENVIKNIQNKVPGHSLVDISFAETAWGSFRIWDHFSWLPLGYPGLANLTRAATVGKWEETPEYNNRMIKKAARAYGAGMTGIAAVNENWFYSKAAPGTLSTPGKEIVFSDNHDKPTIEGDFAYIPRTMNRVIVMLHPMDQVLFKYDPSAMSHAAAAVAYSNMAECACKMAEFLRGIGYNAIPMGNDTSLGVPMALDAGLGEVGRHGLLVNPVYGSLVRISKVLTDLPISTDKPIAFGVPEFCKACKRCAEKCPSGAVSMDDMPSDKVHNESNVAGMVRWYTDGWKCLNFWVENGNPCGRCIGVCPYNKPKAFAHDLVKGISAKTSLLNGTFATMDKALGYGSGLEDGNDPLEWWTQEENPESWFRGAGGA